MTAGYGFSDRWSFILDVNSSKVDAANGLGSYQLAQAVLGARFHFNEPKSFFRPYLDAGFAGRAIAVTITDPSGDVEVEANGGGVSVGGGFQWFMSRTAAIDLGLRYVVGSFDEWKADGRTIPVGSIDATSAIVRLGISFWPSIPK